MSLFGEEKLAKRGPKRPKSMQNRTFKNWTNTIRENQNLGQENKKNSKNWAQTKSNKHQAEKQNGASKHQAGTIKPELQIQ